MKMMLGALVASALAWSAWAQRAEPAPEAATGRSAKALGTARSHMVAAANPYAAEAGREILRNGGSAIDAAIATQLVLGLVEPQSSGLGGGAFILHYEAATAALVSYDGREAAPAAAMPDRFLRDGRPMPFDGAVHSGLSVGVPGLVRLMEDAHRRHGRLPWPDLFEPAIRLARQGFAVSSRLHLLLRWMGAPRFGPGARNYFFDASGAPPAIGSTLRNPEYADTLERVAREGAAGFYSGPVADAIVAAVRAAPGAPGDLDQSDLSSYAIHERAPLCTTYRTVRVCGMAPPSSGGLVVAQTLAVLERYDIGRAPTDAMNVQAMHLVAEAEKLAYADRDRYVADPDFVPVPTRGLVDAAYLAARSALVAADQVMARPEPGVPPGLAKHGFGADAARESTGTTHLSVIDRDGNVVAMTSTIEAAFGSRLWAAGFLLNNQLTDFSFHPVAPDGRQVANRVEGGKRPRSSMAPTIVFDREGRVLAALGSPGGARIPLYVVKTLVALLDWRLDAAAAAALENFGSRGGSLEIELGWRTIWHALRLAALGHTIETDFLTSGTHVIVRRPDGMIEGGADPRREGVALGD